MNTIVPETSSLSSIRSQAKASSTGVAAAGAAPRPALVAGAAAAPSAAAVQATGIVALAAMAGAHHTYYGGWC